MRNDKPLSAVAVSLMLALLGAIPAATAAAGEPSPVPLPPPQIDGGKPLMQALALRATSRAFSPDPIPAQTLSNLLWAAWGFNRPGDGRRTAPSARNRQEIDLLVVLPDGAFLYDAAANRLIPAAPGDHRARTGVQSFVKDAPLTLLLVADASKIPGAGRDPEALQMVWADAGFISQNIYLFCASEGLATGVRAHIDRPALAGALGWKENRIILLAQSVGRPARR